MSKIAIQLKDVSKSYPLGGDAVQAIQNASLEINEGDFISIIGPSGSGKSTLLHLLSGLDQPTGGQIIINGKHIYRLKDKNAAKYRNENIGFVFQDFHLLKYLTLEENIALPLHLKSSDTKKRTLELMEELGIADRAQHKPYQVSGGQKQRAAIARALVMNPKIIVADEPTGNLDSATGQEIIEILKKINRERKITTIVATHDQHIAAIAHKVIEIKDGQLHERAHTKKYTQ